MGTLVVTTKGFTNMIGDLIESGVTFEAVEKDGLIIITFTGGY